MNWQEGVAVAVVLIGLGAGACLVAKRPSFWIEFQHDPQFQQHA